jgi:hypothetical protein
VEIDVDPYMTPDEIIATGKLSHLRKRARSIFYNVYFLCFALCKVKCCSVIIVEMGMDIHAAKSFMVAVQRSQMKTHDYVYMIPWLSHVS